MDVPPLISNKHVKIIKNYNNYTILCLKREMTPGVFSKINVTKQSWYTIELCCTKFGYGSPGLWIATPSKKTLFYGNYFTQHGRGYLKRSFYTGDYTCLLVGILVKNATIKSGFILEKLTITEIPKQIEEENVTTLTYSESGEKKKIVNEEVKKVKKVEKIRKVDANLAEQPEFKKKLDYNVLFNKCNKHKNVNANKNSSIVPLSIPKQPVKSIFPEENVTITIKDLSKVNNDITNDITNEVVNTGNINDNAVPLITDIPILDEVANDYKPEKEIIYNITGLYEDIDINVDIFTYPTEDFHIYPISLSIPKENVLSEFPVKEIDFFPYKLGTSLLSNYENKREQFYKDLGKSRFILISKRDFGEDDPVYYEALSKGCIPIFVNDVNEYTSPFLPKEMLTGIKNSNGVNIGWIDASKFSYSGFEKISKHLLAYTREHLTTENIAKYLITIADKSIKNVLFLANSICGGDFLLQQSLIHGLKGILGDTNVVDYPKVLSLYKNKHSNFNNEIRLGLPYGQTLKESDVSRGRINKRIENREFDLIIIMGIFTEKDRKRLNIEDDKYPFFSSIDEHYDTDEIFFIDGNNAIPDENFVNRLYKYSNSGVCFCKDFL